MTHQQFRVLLIEHDAAFARYFCEIVAQARDLSAEVLPAADLREGFAKLLQADFVDVVVMDLAVPDGAGLANIELIKKEAPHVPVIVAGDSDDDVVALEVMHSGAQDYLVKGQLTPSWLERSIRYAMERHRMDRALMEAEEKYHSVFDHLVEGIFQTTPDGRYLMANAALAKIYGYDSPEELIGHLQDIEQRLYVEKDRRAEFVRLMQESDTLEGFESRVYRRDGAVIWISENCRAVRDARGRLVYYEGTVEDITKRRQAEEKVRMSEALYHSLVETLPQNIFRKDLQGQFTFANQQFCRSLGRPLEEIIGKTDFDFFPAELARKYQKDDRRVLESGEPYETVEEHQPPGGQKMYVQVVKTPLRGPSHKIIGLQAIFWDITEQRRAEEKIKRANAALAQSRQELRTRNLQMEEDLNMAREIQLTMLPQQYPVFPRPGFGAGDTAFQFTHRYLPTGSVGGDFFAASALTERVASVFVCDVAGHGVRSALVTAMIRALVEELRPLAGHPGAFLTKINSDLCAILRHTGTPMLTTAFYLVADWTTGVMQYANAGHPKPLHLRRAARQVVSLTNTGARSQPALGLLEEAQYQTSEIILQPRDLVLLYTDGLVEIENARQDLYSTQLLVEAVRKRLDQPSGRLVNELLEEARRFAANGVFMDDVCLVGMDYLGPGKEPAERQN